MELRFPDTTKAVLSVEKGKHGMEAELILPDINYVLNKSSDGFQIDLNEYENQKLDVTIHGKEVLNDKGKLVKRFSNIFDSDKIVDLTKKGDKAIVHIGDYNLLEVDVDKMPKDLFKRRDNFKINVKADDKLIICRFANLHQHTENSLLDGIVRIDELCKKTEYCSAITDHGNMLGWYEMWEEFKKAGKKAIIGEEFYVQTLNGAREVMPRAPKKDDIDVEELMFDNIKIQNPEGLNGEHLILLAKNNVGLKTLFKLSSEASNHYYRKPHITIDDLKKHHEGLICTSACIAGTLGQSIKAYLSVSKDRDVAEWKEQFGEFFYNESEYLEIADEQSQAVKVYAYNHALAREFVDLMLELFGNDFYFEYQDHHFPEENKIMEEMVRIRNDEYPDVKIIATTDAHYLNPEDAEVHELWLCSQTGSNINDPKHMRFSGDGYWVHTSAEMLKDFDPEYLDNTLEIMDKVQYEELDHSYHLPHFPLPDGFENEVDYFKFKCTEGYKRLFKGTEHYKNPEYLQRMQDEINVIVSMGWPAYFLIVSDFIAWSEDTDVASHIEDYFPSKYFKKEDIPKELIKNYKIYVGVARGSGAGALVNYCLGITKVNPIDFDLKFERFLNPDRISMPDIDTDFEDATRENVLEYVRFKYGKNRVASIIAPQTTAAKNSVKTINRVLGGSVAQGDMIAKMIPNAPGTTLKSCLETNEFRNFYDTNEYGHKVIDYALRIEGLKTALSIHPCGVLVADSSITNYMPEILMKNPKTDEMVWVTQMDGPTCEHLGLLKMDFLGLRTLGYVHETIDLIKQNEGKDIDYDTIPLDDVDVYKWLAEGNTSSIFQIESNMFTGLVKQAYRDIEIHKDRENFGKELFSRLVDMNALVRPGSNMFINDYCERIMDPDKISYLVPQLEPIIKSSYGIILFQEQTMRITRDLAGFSAGQADTVRKAMGKKIKSLMDEYEEYFVTGNKQMGIAGCVANGIPEDKARQLWAVMAEASKYSFNKSHAVAYSMHSFRTAWLAYYHKYEYMTAVLNSYITNSDKIAVYLGVAKRKGMTVLPPSINESNLYFTTNGQHIRLGLAGIKDVASFASTIIDDRKKNGLYKDLKDFLVRMSYVQKFNKKVLKSFIYSGVFDEYEGTRQDKLDQFEDMADYVKKLKDYRKKLNDGKVHKKLVEPEFNFTVYNHEMPAFDKILKEKEYSGMYITGGPVDEFKAIIDAHKVTPLDNIFSVIDDENDIEKKAIKGQLKIAGVIEDVKIKTSNKGNSFRTFNLEDETHTINCVYFGKRDNKGKDLQLELIQDDNPVILDGEVRIDDFGVTFTVKNIISLHNEMEGKKRMKGIIKVKVTDDREKDLKRIGYQLKNIHYLDGDMDVVVVYKGKEKVFRPKVALTSELSQELKKIVGDNNVEIEYIK